MTYELVLNNGVRCRDRYTLNENVYSIRSHLSFSLYERNTEKQGLPFRSYIFFKRTAIPLFPLCESKQTNLNPRKVARTKTIDYKKSNSFKLC